MLKKVLLVTAPLPAVYLNAYCRRTYLLPGICSPEAHPLILVNWLFFVNVTIGFWIISLFGSTWVSAPFTPAWHASASVLQLNGPAVQLIDPYWTLAPPLICHFYRASLLHGTFGSARQLIATALLWVWNIRLTHSYFRRLGF